MSEFQSTDIEVSERIKLKVGTFECDLSAGCLGTVTVDGEPIKVKKFVVVCEAGKLASINVDLIPMRSQHKVTALGEEFEKK